MSVAAEDVRDYLTDRFMERVIVTEGCWLWDGVICSSAKGGGYAKFSVNVEGTVRTFRMARFAHERFVGPIPAGHEVDHLCRNRECVRPDHLEAVTNAENMRRAWAARRGDCPVQRLGRRIVVARKPLLELAEAI